MAGQDQAFRLLCLACHSEVSEPSERRAINPIISHFSPETYEAFVRSPRPAQCVTKLNSIDPEREIVNIDVRRCRRSYLVNSTEPWPVFCAHDEVRVNQSDLGDFNWVDAGKVNTAKRQFDKRPYQGRRFYSREATQYLLDKQIVTWSNINITDSATAHLPADFFKSPLDNIERTIDPELAKKAINSILGVWSVDRHYTYMVATQYNSNRFPFDGKVMVRMHLGDARYNLSPRDPCY